ncbi:MULTISPECIES: response regulator transcription factor [Streptomyces]|uniref:DNA-binding response regulator n=1 Tax=Streptomyces lasiicapitis TaxID=1923961 RepID=A0ABQ2LJQ5_9ACTN|nr:MULTISPECIES: response regulator transcription factor [Streptomyces]QIB42389.1 response regulator transcription factor [Streptomyces aureoverticillatus]GGO37529.1 DNA-binding response regulator [Streptomyces lasiicapitis]
MKIRVLVCCDESIMSAAMRALLDQQPDIDVTGFTTGRESAAAVAEMAPHVMIVVAPALGLEDKRELAELAELTKIILIAKAESAHRSVEALCVGVRAVLAPDSSADDLIHVLRTVSAGATMVMPAAARRTLEHLPQQGCSRRTARMAAELTPRESEVIVLLAQGKSNAEVAEKLSVSLATVRSHVHHVLRKMGVSTRAQAVAIAYETGLMAAIGRTAELRGQEG